MILLLVLVTGAASVVGEVVCYECHGNSTNQGQFCSINNLCVGESCFFSVQPNGQWSSGCSEDVAPMALNCSINGSTSVCKCTYDLCNQLKNTYETMVQFWSEEQNFSYTLLMLPRLSVNCIECGNITVGGRSIFIPCNENHICQGEYCVTRRGMNPISFCGTSWSGTNKVQCYKNVGEDERCVCDQDMCNFILAPGSEFQKMTLPSENNSTSNVTTSSSPSQLLDCKEGITFSPNAQATLIGEKLGQIILDGISSNKSNADGIEFLCN
ncbi:hypothetical protein DICVIV_02809 [Dictyocaulus viviparus]|uniref:DUF7741 domain-containing protein n=1 Tax=Dictyocaulus viviparus TaxID=29172 RepID=A0A0D8Y2E1_DICVI|nr:hypothetical protein DICVIV_02809 [Dictyocaulus viviparus]